MIRQETVVECYVVVSSANAEDKRGREDQADEGNHVRQAVAWEFYAFNDLE